MAACPFHVDLGFGHSAQLRAARRRSVLATAIPAHAEVWRERLGNAETAAHFGDSIASVRDRRFGGLMRGFPGRMIVWVVDRRQLAVEVGQHDRGAFLHVGLGDTLALTDVGPGVARDSVSLQRSRRRSWARVEIRDEGMFEIAERGEEARIFDQSHARDFRHPP